MKKFREYMTEEMLPYAQTEKGFVGVDNGPVRDNINVHLTAITGRPYATPYHALEMVRKVLAPFHIGLPATRFLDGDSGHEVFEINQFGERVGMRNNGDVVTKSGSPYFVYFEYSLNDRGGFDIFSEIVNQDELDDLLADVESEMEDGDDGYYSDSADASDSYDDYKANNKLNESSKALLQRYLPKASASHSSADITQHYTGDAKALQTRNKRSKGITLARRKIGKPEGWDTGKAKVLAKEDWDSVSKNDADQAKAISKTFRKKDKPEAKAWRQATRKLYKKAVTGLPQKRVKGLGGLDEVSRDYILKMGKNAFDLHHKYLWKDDYKRADKKIAQIDKMREYLHKKGLAKTPAAPAEPDDQQKKYNQLVYKGD